MEHEGDRYTNHDFCIWYSQRKIKKGTGGLGNRKKSGDHPNYNIIENGQNTEKSPGDLCLTPLRRCSRYIHKLQPTEPPLVLHTYLLSVLRCLDLTCKKSSKPDMISNYGPLDQLTFQLMETQNISTL